MIDRKEETEEAPPPASVATRRANAKSKRDEKRFDALADEEPQICRGID